MSERRDRDFLDDIREAVRRIGKYTSGMTYQAFLKDTKTQDAVIRNLEIWKSWAKRRRTCRSPCGENIRAYHGKRWQASGTG